MTHKKAAMLHVKAAQAQTPEATDKAWQATMDLVPAVENGPSHNNTIRNLAENAVQHMRHGREQEAHDCHIDCANAHLRRARELTLKGAKLKLAELGITINKRDDTYRVNFKGGFESTAYYTDDIEDALGTGGVMAKYATSAGGIKKGKEPDRPDPVSIEIWLSKSQISLLNDVLRSQELWERHSLYKSLQDAFRNASKVSVS